MSQEQCHQAAQSPLSAVATADNTVVNSEWRNSTSFCAGPAAAMHQANRAGAACLGQQATVQRTLAKINARRPRLAMQAATEQAVQQQQSCSPTQFLRPHLLKLAAYTPIEPFEILSSRYGRSPQDIVKLDANENPYGPPPEVREALANMPFPHIYPDPETRRLRKALAEWNDIPMEHLLVSEHHRTSCDSSRGSSCCSISSGHCTSHRLAS